MAACGGYFTVAVTEDGELLACGFGGHGQLGLGAVLHQQQPARAGGLELFANQRIRLAAAGWRHLAVVAEDGAVYTCGYGGHGQLGTGDGQPRRRLTRVPQALFAGSRVVMVSCGGSHTMAVTAVGHAWTCGRNECGQLGVGDTANRLGFTRVDAGQLGGARIVMAACGWWHSVMVSAEGGVCTFGYGRGLGLNDEQDRLVPTLLAAEVFKGSKIVTVAASTPWPWEWTERCGRGAGDPPAGWAWATPTTGWCRRWWVRRRCLGVPRCARFPAAASTRWQ